MVSGTSTFVSMALKRKRSSPSLSSLASDGSVASPDQLFSFYFQSKPIEPLFHKSSSPFPTYNEKPHREYLNSRTRKRHRDGRPDDQTVYGVSCWLGAVINMSTLADVCRCAASTINRLYDAQRQHPHASPVRSQTSMPQRQPNQPQKNTLHAFWRICQPPIEASLTTDSDHIPNTTPVSRCEDCDGALRHEEAMDIDEAVFEHETTCHICQRHVCDTCAIRGDVRICLSCSSGRSW